jgi:hypothetical protein
VKAGPASLCDNINTLRPTSEVSTGGGSELRSYHPRSRPAARWGLTGAGTRPATIGAASSGVRLSLPLQRVLVADVVLERTAAVITQASKRPVEVGRRVACSFSRASALITQINSGRSGDGRHPSAVAKATARPVVRRSSGCRHWYSSKNGSHITGRGGQHDPNFGQKPGGLALRALPLSGGTRATSDPPRRARASGLPTSFAARKIVW